MRETVRSFLRYINRGFMSVAFPHVCICCGIETTEPACHICSFCREEKFEDSNPDNSLSSGDAILPDYVQIQHALWNFDKGGDLQELLHHLKYERLTNIGIELGKILGERMRLHPTLHSMMDDNEVVLIPVPLYYRKFHQRGFNQAFMIAKGIQQEWNVPVCSLKTVVRQKNTRSQTGFSLHKRLRNMKDAFKVRNSEELKGKVAVVVDDVFTTGTTAFELAGTLKEAGTDSVIIVTVAQA